MSMSETPQRSFESLSIHPKNSDKIVKALCTAPSTELQERTFSELADRFKDYKRQGEDCPPLPRGLSFQKLLKSALRGEIAFQVPYIETWAKLTIPEEYESYPYDSGYTNVVNVKIDRANQRMFFLMRSDIFCPVISDISDRRKLAGVGLLVTSVAMATVVALVSLIEKPQPKPGEGPIRPNGAAQVDSETNAGR